MTTKERIDKRRRPTRDPNIVQYPNDNYYFRGRVNGVFLDDVSLKTKKWSIAVHEANKLRGIYNDRDSKEKPLTFEELFPIFMAEQKLRLGKSGKYGLRNSTYAEYEEKRKNHIMPFFQYINVRDMSKGDAVLEEFLAGIKVKPRNIFKVLMKFLRWAHRKQYIYRIPHVELPDENPRKGHALRPDERKLLLQKAPTFKCRLFILMYMLMAMRRSEILKLEWSRVFLENGAIWLGAEHTKTKKERWVPIHPTVIRILINWKTKCLGPYVFPSRWDPLKHISTTGLDKQFNVAKLAAGMPTIVPHDLRRTYTTEANKDAGKTDAQREKFIGSSAKVQKDIYTDFDVEDVRSMAEIVEVDGLESIVMSDLGHDDGVSE